MFNLKSLIVAAAAIMTFAVSANEKVVILHKSENIRVLTYGVLEVAVKLPRGTRIVYTSNKRKGLGSNQLYRNSNEGVSTSKGTWKRVLQINLMGNHVSARKHRIVREINENRAKGWQQHENGRDSYFISTSTIAKAQKHWGRNHNPTPKYNHNSNYTSSSNDVVYSDAFNVCYQEKFRTYSVKNKELKKKADEKKAAAFAFALIGAAAKANGSKDFGNVALGFALVLGTIGLVESSQATSIDTTYGDVHCRDYYRPTYTSRTHIIDNQTCYTTEYESVGWDHTYYHYETTCSGRRYHRYSEDRWRW